MTKAAAPDRTPGSLRTVIDGAHRRLSAAGVPSPRHDAEALAAFVIGCPPARLLVAGDLSAGQHVVFTELVARRESRIPLQHLTGSAAFRYLELAVGPGVFVPRPETEVVAGWCIDALRMRAIDPADLANPAASSDPALVVDLCTGSGAIALSIAQEVKGTVVHAVEREAAAFTWARRNVTGSRVILHQADASARAGRARRSGRPGRQQPAVPARDPARRPRAGGARPRSGRRAVGWRRRIGRPPHDRVGGPPTCCATVGWSPSSTPTTKVTPLPTCSARRGRGRLSSSGKILLDATGS